MQAREVYSGGFHQELNSPASWLLQHVQTTGLDSSWAFGSNCDGATEGSGVSSGDREQSALTRAMAVRGSGGRGAVLSLHCVPNGLASVTFTSVRGGMDGWLGGWLGRRAAE